MGTQGTISASGGQCTVLNSSAPLSKEFLFRAMLSIANAFWVFFCDYLVSFLGRLFGSFFRLKVETFGSSGSDRDSVNVKERDKFVDDCWEMFDSYFFGEIESFVADSGEENRGKEESSADEMGIVLNASTNKYQIVRGSSLSGFIEEPETASFKVHEFFADSVDQSVNNQEKENCKLSASDHNDQVVVSGSSADSECEAFNAEAVALRDEEDLQKEGVEEEGLIMVDSPLDKHDFSDEVRLSSEKDLVSIDADQESISPSDESSYEAEWFSDSQLIALTSLSEVSFLSENDHLVSHGPEQGTISPEEELRVVVSDESASEALEPKPQMGSDEKIVDSDENSPKSVDYTLKETVSQALMDDEEIGLLKYMQESDATKHGGSDEGPEARGLSEGFGEVEKQEMETVCSDADYEVECDVLLQHKEMVQKLKREMRGLKVKGMPTILEECESPRMEEDLKPLKIDEKVEHKDRMEEVQVFYKSYSDKMKKMDILSHQTMNSIGFLQLKNQDQLDSKKKASAPVVKSLQNLRPSKLKRNEADPFKKLMKDLQRDLELVYVAQLSLSWEILKWQHEKALELQELDPNGLHQFNLAAAEFEQFQVLVQRFTEDEPFHGPRIQNYLKGRGALSNLLQVPPIKDDPKSVRKEDEEVTVSVARLIEIVEESMRVFWEFLRSDKDEVTLASKIIHGSHVDLQDPSDMELLSNVRSSLQKKERKLKDLIRSGNCIVKKFQKHQDYRLNHELSVAQVELRLVSRVLSMSRLTTDQLQWCYKKLSKINLVGRKVHVDSSFLLFPC